jgi:hypothetical protein
MSHSFRGDLHRDGHALVIALLLERSVLAVEDLSGVDPERDEAEEDDTQVRRACGEGSKADDHDLLDRRAAGLAEGVADDIDRSLALRLHLCIERDVCHLLHRRARASTGVRTHFVPDE